MSDPKRKKTEPVKPGAILRAAAAGGRPVMPNFADAAASAARAPDPRPRLQVEHSGERVARIIAYCRCGEKIVIDCDYPTGPVAEGVDS